MTVESAYNGRPGPTMVLHPEREAGVLEAISSIRGLTIVDARTDEAVRDALRSGADALLTHVWDDRFLQPGLRWIQCQGAGVEQFPHDRLRASGVVLTNARGAHPAAAEHAFGMLLGLTRGIARSVRDQARHNWHPSSEAELGGTTMVILGLGTIGEQIAVRAQGWDLRVIGIKRDPSSYEGVVADVRPLAMLLESLDEADILVVTMPGGPQAAPVVDAEALRRLGDGVLVNVGRGSVVDEDALLRWLSESPRRAAGLDVFRTEPLPDTSPLWDLPNVIVTPHCAGSSRRYGERLAPIVRANLDAFLGVRPWLTRVV